MKDNIGAKSARKIDNLMKKITNNSSRIRWKFVRILKISTIFLRVWSILPSVKKSRKPRLSDRDRYRDRDQEKPETFRDSRLETESLAQHYFLFINDGLIVPSNFSRFCTNFQNSHLHAFSKGLNFFGRIRFIIQFILQFLAISCLNIWNRL